MNEIYQKTLSKKVSLEGIGLHSGKSSKITLLPAKENHGIVFQRVDLKNNNFIKANFANVSSARLCTTLQNDHGIKVSTVEHLLAALYITGIDNALVEINNIKQDTLLLKWFLDENEDGVVDKVAYDDNGDFKVDIIHSL